MARSRLSIHAIPEHHPHLIVDFARKLQPPVILIVNPDAGFVSDCYQASPESLFSLRNHPISEQKEDMYRDPVGTGVRHADEMIRWSEDLYAEAARRGLPMPPIDRVVMPGINEPLVHSDEQINAVVRYNVAYLDRLRERNRRGTALEFSVGWPRNAGNDTSPQWEPFRPVYEACKRGNHLPSIHEYWPKEGPAYWATWLAYRLVTWIPSYWADLDFIFTEVGLDDAALPGRAHAFWKDFFSHDPQRYISQYHEFEWNCRSLSNREGVKINILGYCMFTCDYGGSEWENADIAEIRDLWVNFVNTNNFPEPAPKHTVVLPDVRKETPAEPPRPEPIPHHADNAMDWTIQSLCRVFGYDLNLVRAILRVESGGRPFQGGRPIIRNEVHLLHDYMENKQLWRDHFRTSPDRRWQEQQWRRSIADPWQNIHVNQAMEWQVFEFAKQLNSRAAHLALGMGAAQIMGFNYRIPEYASPEAMLVAFSDDTWGAANQVLAMFAYFYKVDGLADAIRNRDLPTIALKYNGPGQVDYYVKRFKEELDALTNDRG